MDETFQTYLNRVARLALPADYLSQLQNIQESPKFKPLPDGDRQAVAFPGYSVITPPWGEDPKNTEFYTPLQTLQAQLVQELDPGLLVPVPPESFHLTVADLIWDSAYRNAVSENPDFESQLRDRIEESFRYYQQSVTSSSQIRWQLLGLMIRPRALTVCLIPKDEQSYDQILQLRRSIYQNSDLIALGIEQQYYFTAHITLGYFGEISPDLKRDRISDTLVAFDQQWLETEPQIMMIHQAQLCKFDDMTRYYREPSWPILEF